MSYKNQKQHFNKNIFGITRRMDANTALYGGYLYYNKRRELDTQEEL